MLIKASQLSLAGRFSQLNFSIAPAEILFLLGPNGAGKSSLLSVLSGYTAYHGDLLFHHKQMSTFSASALAEYRAWLPQLANIDPYISIEQAFELALFPLGLSLSSPRVSSVLSNLLKALDLTKLQNRLLGQLSGGEQQRVHIGLRLMQVWPDLNPKACLLLLDEPTNGLDLHHQKALFDLLQQLKAKGLAIIICVHDLNLALRYGDSVLMIKAGQAVYSGCVQQAFSTEMIEGVFEVKSTVLEHQGQQYLILD